MKKILIFGGNRFVGELISQRLKSLEFNVDVFNRSGTRADYGINIIQGDRNNQEDINIIDFEKYYAIIDMCLYKPSQFELIKDLISTKTNYIFVSSGAADKRYVESFGDYGRDKLEIEDVLKSTDINFDIIRPSYIVGENSHRPRLKYFIDKLASKEVIEVGGDGKNKINIVYQDDVVKVLENLVLRNSPKRKTYNVSGDKSWSVMNLISITQEKFFYDTHKAKVAHNKSDSIFGEFDFELDNSDVKKELEIEFTDIGDILDKVWDDLVWFGT